MMNTYAFMKIQKPDVELLLDIREPAEAAGLVLVTDGEDLAYTLPQHIPPGWTRFVPIRSQLSVQR